MENVILTIHLILSVCLIGVVLLQRSEGGGLGLGGGGGGGVISGRQAATALSKLTWIFAAGFIATSITLTVIAAKNSAGQSVADQISTTAPAGTTSGTDTATGSTTGTTAPAEGPLSGDLLPPSTGDAPAAPPRVD